MKLKDKVRIGSSYSSAYIDFENHIYYFDANEKGIRLNLNEIKILKCLCNAYNADGVENYQIFKFINSYDFDRDKGMDMIPITRIISKLRQKITIDGKESSEQYIKTIRRGTFKIILPESPFESIEPIKSSEKIDELKTIVTPTIADTKISTTEILPSVIDTSKMTSNSFFTFVENHIDYIKTLQIACHVGDMWLNPCGRRYRILTKLFNLKKSKIQVIINTSTAVEDVFKHMRDEKAYQIKMYRSLNETIHIWSELAQANANVWVKKCSYPLLHNYVCCEFNENINPIMRIGLYMYGDSLSEDKPHFNFGSDDEYYELLKSEFEYLWNISEYSDDKHIEENDNLKDIIVIEDYP